MLTPCWLCEYALKAFELSQRRTSTVYVLLYVTFDESKGSMHTPISALHYALSAQCRCQSVHIPHFAGGEVTIESESVFQRGGWVVHWSTQTAATRTGAVYLCLSNSSLYAYEQGGPTYWTSPATSATAASAYIQVSPKNVTCQ